MKYPKYLTKGDKITFIAPSFGATVEPYTTRTINAKKKLIKRGYQVFYGENVEKAELPYLSNTPELIGKEFMEHYNDSDCLISVGGGEMQVETLPYVDFESIKNKTPKWFLGFSDNTNYTFQLETVSDTASLYGMCASQFGMYKYHESVSDALELIEGTKNITKGYPTYQGSTRKYQKEHPLAGFNLNKEKVLTLIPSNKIHMEGRLIGGCLDVLLVQCGTKYDHVKEFLERYKDDGFIWALEACDLTAIALRRAYFQLREAGWFKYCKGFLIGRPARAFNDEDFGINRFEALEPLKSLNVPIIADFDLGHIKPTMPLVMGSYVKVDAKDNDVSVEQLFI